MKKTEIICDCCKKPIHGEYVRLDKVYETYLGDDNYKQVQGLMYPGPSELHLHLQCFKTQNEKPEFEALKEFVNKLKVHAYYIDFPKEHRVIDEDDIDNTLKVFLEGMKNV